jgi:hypothetical protein
MYRPVCALDDCSVTNAMIYGSQLTAFFTLCPISPAFSLIRLSRGMKFVKIYILFTHIIKFLIHRRRDCNKFNQAFEHLLHVKRGSVISTRSSTQISEQWQILWLMSNRTETGGKFPGNLIENNYLGKK